MESHSLHSSRRRTSTVAATFFAVAAFATLVVVLDHEYAPASMSLREEVVAAPSPANARDSYGGSRKPRAQGASWITAELTQVASGLGYTAHTSTGYSQHTSTGYGYRAPTPPPLPLYYRQLADKQKSYDVAINTAVQAKAAFDVAKRDAVSSKLDLDTFKKKQELHQAVYVHKAAAYVEVKRAASEERAAKATTHAAEVSTKLAARKTAQATKERAHALKLSKQATADKKAALQEIRAAAVIKRSKDPNANVAVAQGKAIEKASNTIRAFKKATEAGTHPSDAYNAQRALDKRHETLLNKVESARKHAQAAADRAVSSVDAAKAAATAAVNAPANTKEQAEKVAKKTRQHAEVIVQHSEADATAAANEFGALVKSIEEANHVGIHSAVVAARKAMKYATMGKDVANSVVKKLYTGTAQHGSSVPSNVRPSQGTTMTLPRETKEKQTKKTFKKAQGDPASPAIMKSPLGKGNDMLSVEEPKNIYADDVADEMMSTMVRTKKSDPVVPLRGRVTQVMPTNGDSSSKVPVDQFIETSGSGRQMSSATAAVQHLHDVDSPDEEAQLRAENEVYVGHRHTRW